MIARIQTELFIFMFRLGEFVAWLSPGRAYYMTGDGDWRPYLYSRAEIERVKPRPWIDGM